MNEKHTITSLLEVIVVLYKLNCLTLTIVTL